MKKINFGLIGCGAIAKKGFIPAIKKSKNSQLVAVASRNKKKALSFSKEFKCESEDSYESIITREDIDAIYISTVPSTHEKIIIAAANQGKHILCEKPLTNSYNSAKRIVNHCKKKNVAIFEGFMYQFHSQHQTVKKIIQDHKIGKPMLFTANFGFPLNDKDNFRYKNELGGGALLDAGCYTIHAARKFFQREPIEIHSIINKNSDELDTQGMVMLDFGHGQGAQLSFGFNNSYRNTYSIWCENGHITLSRAFSIPEDFQSEITIERLGNKEVFLCEPDNHFLKEIDFFSNKILFNDLIYESHIDIINQYKIIDKIKKR